MSKWKYRGGPSPLRVYRRLGALIVASWVMPGLSLANGSIPACVTNEAALYKYRDDMVRFVKENPARYDEAINAVRACFRGQPTYPGCFKDLAPFISGPGPIPQERLNKAASLRLPDIFMDGNRYRVPENFDEIARRNEWLTVAFKTHGEGGFDKTTDHLQITIIPGKSLTPPQDVNWYVQWGLKKEREDTYGDPIPRSHKPSGGTFAAIAMEENSDGTTTPYFYLIDTGATQRQEGLQPNVKDCLRCHLNGLREISPRGYYPVAGETQMDDATKETVRRINDRMGSYGFLTYGPKLAGDPSQEWDPQKEGPPIGSMPEKDSFWEDFKEAILSEGTRSPEFILGQDGHSGCAFKQRTYSFEDALERPDNARTFTMSDHPVIRPDKIAKAMNCAKCHDNLMDRSMLIAQNTPDNNLVTKILVDQSMPMSRAAEDHEHSWAHPFSHEYDLNADERIALINCVKEEAKMAAPGWFEHRLKDLQCSPPRGAAEEHCSPGNQNGSVEGLSSSVSQIVTSGHR